MAESSLSVDFFVLARRLSRGTRGARVYHDGTIDTSGTTATLTGGTFPDWADNGTVQIGTDLYTVASRDSGTQLTLDSSAGTNSGVSYCLWEMEDREVDELLDYLREGLNKFYNAHDWTFFRPVKVLYTNASYDTGTVAVASGVVTLTGGTWPSWAANGELLVDGTSYTVASRDSDTQLTLNDTNATIASGTEYTLQQVWYDLPDDFAGLDGSLTFRYGDAITFPPIKIVSESTMRMIQQQANYSLVRPRVAAIRPKSHDATTGTRWEIGIWPVAGSRYELHYRYRVRPNELTPANRYPYGSQEHSQTILSAVMSAAALELDRDQSWEVRFEKNLQRSKEFDSEQIAPERLGSPVDTDILGNIDNDEIELVWGDGQHVTYEGY